MPIKGLSQRSAVLGRIKIGGRERINDKVRPVRYDHFIVTTNEQADLGYVIDDSLMRKLFEDQFRMLKSDVTENIYEDRMVNGELKRVHVKTIQHVPDDELAERNQKLKRIQVTLPSDNPDENLVTSLSVYDGRGCRCRGDNETAEWIDPQSGNIKKVSCPCNMLRTRLADDEEIDQRPPHELAKHGMVPNESRGFFCKANGILNVHIEQARIIGGVYQFRTTSINSLKQLFAAMNNILDITDGALAGFPLNLVVEPKQIQPKLNKPAHTGYVVNLTFKANEDEFLRYVIEKKALIQQLRGRLKSKDIQHLPAPGHESRAEQLAIAEEYYAEPLLEEPRDAVMDARYEEKKHPKPRESSQNASQDAKAAAKTSETSKPADARQEPQEAPPEPTEQPAPSERPEAAETVQETQETTKAVEAPDSTPGAQEAPPGDSETRDDPPPVEDSQTEVDQQEDPQDADAHQKGNGFPIVSQDQPDNADISPASKGLRKTFFLAARSSGMSDEMIRTWIEKQWNVQNSAALKTWQVEAMIQSLP